MNNELDKLEALAEHLKSCDFWESGNELLEIVADARSALARRAPTGAGARRALYQAAKDFYNATVADSEVRITLASKEKRDIAAAAADRLRAALAQQSPAPVVALDAPQEAAPSLLSEAYRAVQNCILALPDGQFKRDMDEWLTVRLDLIDDPDDASAISGLRPVASVVSRVGDDLRVGWLRPERCDVGTLLYCATEPEAAHAQQEAAPAEVTKSQERDYNWLLRLAKSKGYQTVYGALYAAPTTVPDHSEREAANADVLLAALRQAERAFGNYDRHLDDVNAMAAIRAALASAGVVCKHRRQTTTALGAATGSGWTCKDCGELLFYTHAPDQSPATIAAGQEGGDK